MSRKHRKTRREKERAAVRAQKAAAEQTAPETTENKKEKGSLGKGPKIIIAISLAVVLLLGIFAGVVAALGYSFDFSKWENTIDVKTRYTNSKLLSKVSANTVVATLGDKELTNGVLQMYYSRAIWDVVEEYSSSLSYIGLDLSKPLNQQVFPYGENMTWEQYFLDVALNAWMQQQILVNMAQEEGYQYPEGLESYLNDLQSYLDEQAPQYGYSSGLALVQKEMGVNATVEHYKAYNEIYNKSAEYYSHLYEGTKPTQEQVEAYYNEHPDLFAGLNKTETPVIDVRHILLVPESSVDEETGAKVYTDESKAACLQQAYDLLEQWKNGEATEYSFGQLAMEYSQDPGSSQEGGLYDLVYQGEMVEAFDAWCFDESRQPGDTDVVETEFGYHIMYFVYGADEWYRAVEQVMITELANQKIAAATEQYDFQVYYWNIVLGNIDFS